jgi:hypothetical protein
VKRSEKHDFEVPPVGGMSVMRDIHRTSSMVKMYMFPSLRAQELGITKANVVFRAIHNLPAKQYESLDFEPLQEYLCKATDKWNMEIPILSFNLISPQRSRIKTYTQRPHIITEYFISVLTFRCRNDLSMYSA